MFFFLATEVPLQSAKKSKPLTRINKFDRALDSIASEKNLVKISKEELLQGASETGYRPEILEKVWRLISILNGINTHPFLKGEERSIL